MKTHTITLIVGAVIFLWGLKDVVVITNAEWTYLLAGGVVMAYGGYTWLYADEGEEGDGEASDGNAAE